MRCNQYKSQVNQYVDNELNFINRYFLKQHLKKCSSCQKELKEINNINILLKLQDRKLIAENNIWLKLENKLENINEPQKVNPVRELRPPTVLADGSFKPPSACQKSLPLTLSMAFSNGVNGITTILYPVLLFSIVLIVNVFIYLFTFEPVQINDFGLLQKINFKILKEYSYGFISIILIIQFLLSMNFVAIFTFLKSRNR